MKKLLRLLIFLLTSTFQRVKYDSRIDKPMEKK